jgi:hypothetical protein
MRDQEPSFWSPEASGREACIPPQAYVQDPSPHLRGRLSVGMTSIISFETIGPKKATILRKDHHGKAKTKEAINNRKPGIPLAGAGGRSLRGQGPNRGNLSQHGEYIKGGMF